MAQNTRRSLYIDRDVQRALLWQLFRHWAIFVGLLITMLLAFESLGAATPRSFGEHLAAVWRTHAPLFIVVAVLFPVFAYDSIKLSHRFVGPVVRLRGALRAAAAGEPVKPLSFRQHDFWHDMADSFNELMEHVQEERCGPTRAATERFDPKENELQGV